MRSTFLSLSLIPLLFLQQITVNAGVIDSFRAPQKLWSPDNNYNASTLEPTLEVTKIEVNCTLTVRQATLNNNDTHILLQGVSVDSNEACFAPNVTSRSGSQIQVQTKTTTRVRDAEKTLHRGKVCHLDIPGWAQIIYKNQHVDLTIPLTNTLGIKCNNDPKKETEQQPAPTPTTTTKPPTPTTTTTTRTTTTTTTTHKPKPTDDGSDDDSGSADWIKGQVTFFNPNQGACGDWNDDNDMIVALGGDWYGNMNAESKYCGQKVLITGPKGNSITVTVKDACPPCDRGHLDLSPAAFAKLGDFDTGILKVKWHFL